ncbi:MAG: hypothetical protein K6G73_07050, partial [Marinilabiliaceae bacterium]|nr:hypothetical protein [Marinilabiliaceae bacterium]
QNSVVMLSGAKHPITLRDWLAPNLRFFASLRMTTYLGRSETLRPTYKQKNLRKSVQSVGSVF